MPDVISLAPANARMFVSLDVHKLSIVAATLPPAGGQPKVERIETTEKANPSLHRPAGRRGGAGGLLRGRARRVRAVAAAHLDAGGV
jgi:hypothetical protein